MTVAQHDSAGITISRKGKVPLGTAENYEGGRKRMIQPSLAGLPILVEDVPALASAHCAEACWATFTRPLRDLYPLGVGVMMIATRPSVKKETL